MFLKRLTIHNEEILIREIIFHKGINLIVDETTSNEKTDTGNSVGKTTVLRLIDFCLDGKGDNIFKDPEFKDSNQKMEKFLKGNNIIITLTLVDDISDEFSEEFVIQRNFLSRKNKIQTINGVKMTSSLFSSTLKEVLFKTTEPKPTFKQLKSKNIRDEKTKLVNTIRVLNSFATEPVYEALHLFWFGLNINSSKDKLVRDKNIEEKLQKRLRKERSLSEIKQSLIIVNKKIEELEEKKELFNLNKKYEADLKGLNDIKLKINKISTYLSRLELRKELIIESKIDLEKNIANIDTFQIKRMYEKAKRLIPNIQKTFEETLAFHNEMIQKKAKFITEELPNLNTEINKSKRQLSLLLSEENRVVAFLKKAGVLEDLKIIIQELNSFYERKGKLEEQKRLWQTTIENLEFIKKELEKINKNIYSKNELIQKRIEEFNAYFSDISNRLDGVHSLLSADNSTGIYKFKIGNIEGNPGTGSKKSQMASFDLAYIKFADSLGISCLHFILQDQIENVHSNQITNLLTEIVEEVNCQFVLPVLRDKLPSSLDIEPFQVIALSQKNKLFKL